jgi:hypothetical protein
MKSFVLAACAAVLAGCGSTPAADDGNVPDARPAAFELAQQAKGVAPPAAPDERAGSHVLGYVEGEVITRREVLQRAGAQLAAVEEDQKERLQEQALYDLVRDRMLYRAAIDAGVPATRDEIDERRDQLVKDLAKSGGTLDAYLHERDITRRELDQMLKIGIVVEKYRRAAIGLRTDPSVHVRPVTDVYVAPEDVTKYYERRPEKFKQAATARCRMLKIATDLEAKDREAAVAAAKARAYALHARLKAGEDWVPVFRQATPPDADPNRADGLAEFPRGKMAPWIEEFAFSSGKGVLSDVKQNGTDFWILRAEGWHDDRVIPFAEAEPRIAEVLRSARVQMAFVEVELAVLDQSSIQPESLRGRVRGYLRSVRQRVIADNGL